MMAHQTVGQTRGPVVGLHQPLAQKIGQRLTLGVPPGQRDTDRDRITLGAPVDQGQQELQGQDVLPAPGAPVTTSRNGRVAR